MKKISSTIILLIALVTVPFTSLAQTNTGSVIMGGGFSLDFQNNKTRSGSVTVDAGNTNFISFSPVLGYFLMDGLAGGLSINQSRSKFESDDDTNKLMRSVFTVGPFVKYYHESGVVGSGQFGFGNYKTESEQLVAGQVVTTDTKDKATEWRVGVGYAHFFNESISIEPTLSYGGQIIKDENDDKEIDNSFRFSIAFHLFFADLF